MKYGQRLPLMLHIGAMRPIQAAARHLKPLAGIDEEHAVEILERVLVSFDQLIERFGQESRAIAGCIVGSLLADFHILERFALDTERSK